ncbi:hypothetical protein HNR23_004027 [Nocardiopsis mwathae]|uniref:Uncharacterized protein n=1 Tax=Nocardiopsis mwathae TaxID=1472723 RepID=A0A7W9YKQ3_9ACTN|nr:hypothetical protein [Nocardiopsis mwathae]MBB6173967.1 hypothetical protein [Nocardiopsis mwathae]
MPDRPHPSLLSLLPDILRRGAGGQAATGSAPEAAPASAHPADTAAEHASCPGTR